MEIITNIEKANIPVVDLSLIEKDRASLVKILGDGLRETGFVAVKNHGNISSNVFKDNYYSLQQVFSLSKETKLKYAKAEIGYQRGYLPLEGETHPNSRVMDCKECWQTGRITHLNIFPDEVPRFDLNSHRLFHLMEVLGVAIIDLLDEYLEADGYLNSLVTKDDKLIGTHLMRSIHYPAIENPELDQDGYIIRGDAHVDLNLITLLPVASKPGLQILTRSREWLTIDVPENYVIINAADMLHLITKGTEKEIPSTLHRIIADETLAKESRFSIPFFMHPNHNMPLINLKTGKPAIAPNGQAMDEAAMYVYWRLKNILPQGTVPDYDTWKKGNNPFIV